MNTKVPHNNFQVTFLVGAERSGTTMLRLMLDYHPRITWQSEFEYVVDMLGDDGSCPPLEEYWSWLSTHRLFLSSEYVIDRSLSYPDLVRSFLAQKKLRAMKPIVGATCHRHFGQLLQFWPGARFIHIVRDPRDVAMSCIGMGWAGNMWHAATRWIEAEQEWDGLKKAIPHEDIIEVQYEKLVATPEHELGRICAFLNVKYESSMLEYADSTTYERPDLRLVYRWKRELKSEEIRLLEARVGKLLTERGYAPSELPPYKVSAMLHRRLAIHDWLFRLRWRIRRYGLPLTICLFLHGRLRNEKFSRWTCAHINLIDTTFLK